MHTLLVSLVRNALFCSQMLTKNIHKCSQILFPYVSCQEHSQMFTKFISTCFFPKTFTNVHKVHFHMFLAKNLHKCSQSSFPHVSCQEHSHTEVSVADWELLMTQCRSQYKLLLNTMLPSFIMLESLLAPSKLFTLVPMPAKHLQKMLQDVSQSSTLPVVPGLCSLLTYGQMLAL